MAIKVCLLEQRAKNGKEGICRKMENNQKKHTRRLRVSISAKRLESRRKPNEEQYLPQKDGYFSYPDADSERK